MGILLDIRPRGERGFTLIELLVVVTTIGILAAIALPAFLGQRQKAADADAKVDVRAASIAIETYSTQAGDYDAAAADLTAIAPEISASRLSVLPGQDTYTVTVSSSSGRSFSIGRVTGGASRQTCAPAGGGCSDDGTW